MIVRKTTDAEAQRVNELFAIAFEMTLTNCPADPGNDRIHHWAAFTDDTMDMMSTFTISDYQIGFDSHSCKMGGIGGVATLPQYRRMGGIRKCFEKALPDMYENGYDFSYLYPFSTNYYRKFGYECCVQKYHATILLGLLNPVPVNGTFRMAESCCPMTEAIMAVDKVWESKYNMMVQHEDDYYKWTKEVNPAVKQEFTYVYFSDEGKPLAYTTFRKVDQNDGRNLVCSRFCFLNKEGYMGLMHVFKSLATDHMYAKFTIPSEASMQYLMPEWSLGAAQWSVQPAGMVRVVNVENALKKAAYIGTGTISIAVKDPQISQNDHCFTVDFTDGKAVSVTVDQNQPDITLTIPTFSALISGVGIFTEAASWMNGIQIHNGSAPFSQVFYRKNLMITDFF